MYDEVKDAIRRDNEVSGVLSTEEQLKLAAEKPSKQKPEVGAKPAHFTNTGARSGMELGSQANGIASTAARKTIPAGSTNGFTDRADDLEARFSKLSNKHTRGVSTPPSMSPPPIPEGFSARRTVNGPREMPPKSIKLPPLEVSNQLPRMPPPTYSPATSYASPRGLSPRRSSTSTRYQFPIAEAPQEEERATMKISDEPTISAETLLSYSQTSSGLSVLLLDVRPREEFNQGSIYGSSVVCIEPISLREG